VQMDEAHMVHFLALGLQIPADHPDRKKYYSLSFRKAEFDSSDVAEITLMSPGDILFLYTDGVYDGSDDEERSQFERVMRNHRDEPAREICNALLDYAVKRDERLQQIGAAEIIDDKTVFIIKRR
jgi:Stage II sporulation protein E (SpoIIE)